MPEEPEILINLPVDWQDSEEIMTRYATNMVVQSADNEVFLSFYEIRPPFVQSRDEFKKLQESQVPIKAKCVSRVVFSRHKLQAFIDVLQKQLEQTPDTYETDEEQSEE